MLLFNSQALHAAAIRYVFARPTCSVSSGIPLRFFNSQVLGATGARYVCVRFACYSSAEFRYGFLHITGSRCSGHPLCVCSVRMLFISGIPLRVSSLHRFLMQRQSASGIPQRLGIQQQISVTTIEQAALRCAHTCQNVPTYIPHALLSILRSTSAQLVA
jgi:hypothetical protein